MKENLSRVDRTSRLAVALLLAAAAAFAPLELAPRLALFGGSAAYLLATALWGSCLGYRMLGISSCPRKVP